MEQYSFKIGDIVPYKDIERMEEECKCCGHIEQSYINTEKMGEITERKMEEVYRTSSMTATDEVVMKDGIRMLRPFLNPVTASNPSMMAFYKIHDKWHAEDAILC